MLFFDAICTETCFPPERPPSRQWGDLWNRADQLSTGITVTHDSFSQSYSAVHPTTTPLLLTPPASRFPHPPPVTITAWRRMIFQNSISQLSSPDQSGKRELGLRDLRRKSTIGFELLCLPIRHQVRITTRLIFMSRGWLKNLTWYLIFFSPAWQTLNWDETGNFVPLINNFPSKATKITNAHTKQKQHPLFVHCHLIYLSESQSKSQSRRRVAQFKPLQAQIPSNPSFYLLDFPLQTSSLWNVD